MKLKNQNEVMPFSGIVLSCDYKSIEPKKLNDMPTYYSRIEIESFTDCDNNDIDKPTYMAQLKLLEVKGGRKPRKHKFNMTLYIDEDTYEQESLHDGDILRFTKVKLNTDNFRLKVYDTEKLKDYPKAKLHKDNFGKTYANMLITSAKLGCSVGDWKLMFKFDELYYFSINRVKFYQTCKQDMEHEDVWEGYITKGEYNKLKQLDGVTTEMKCYAKKIKFATYNVKFETHYEKDINKYYFKAQKEEK